MTTSTINKSKPGLQKLDSNSGQESLPLGERLLLAGIITRDNLEMALAEQAAKKLRLGETLLHLGLVSEEDLLPFVGQQLKVKPIRLREGLVDPQVVQLLPRHLSESIHSLALFKVRDILTVAMAEPQNLRHIDEIEQITQTTIRPVLAIRKAIDKLIPRCYEDNFAVDEISADIGEEDVEIQEEVTDLSLHNSESLSEESPIVNLVNYMLVQAVRKGASDIHIEPGRRQSSVRFRIDGQLREMIRPRKDIHPSIISRLKVMAKMDIAEHRIPQDGRIHLRVEGRTIDVRASTLPTVLGEKVVLRILDRKSLTFNLDELGVPHDMLATLKQLLAKPHGLVLVTGPTGSGKTTTLYSFIELIKSIERNIITVEDPVEYELDLINQVHTNPAASLTFASALRSILRQDPDIIMIGEIRDGETAEVAVQAALTGHLVLSTLHTNDTASAITRLMDLGVAPFKISASLAGVVAQRLVRTICPNCQIQYYPQTETLDAIRYQGDWQRQFVRGEGCSDCGDTGYRGRIGIYEVLTVTRELGEIITTTNNIEAIRNWHFANGGTTLLKEGIKLAEDGKTTIEEVMRVALLE